MKFLGVGNFWGKSFSHAKELLAPTINLNELGKELLKGLVGGFPDFPTVKVGYNLY